MRMCFALLFTLWLMSAALCDAEDFKIVCYFASWTNYRKGVGKFTTSNIDPTLCTHLVYAFVGITEDGNVKVLDPWNDLPENGGNAGFEKFVALRELSPKTKFMVAIGGWNEGSVKYSRVVENSTLRSNFVKNVVNFTLRHKFDGFDLDWEYPNQIGGKIADVENFVLLVKELRTMFDQHGLILSAAVGAEEILASWSYNVSKISKYLHFVNLMTFEFHRLWFPTTGDFHRFWFSNTGLNSPLYSGKNTPVLERSLNCNESVNYWLNHGASPEDLILGLAFFGRSFTLNDSSQHEPGSPVTGSGDPGRWTNSKGMLAYYEICQNLLDESSWTSVWEKEEKVPYAYGGDQWISYDNVESITEKMKYAKGMGLGGVMIWSIDTDDFRGSCGKPNPLLNAINDAVRGSELSPKNEQSKASHTYIATTSNGVGNIAACSTIQMLTIIWGIARL